MMGQRQGGNLAMLKPLLCISGLLLISLAAVNGASVDGDSSNSRKLRRHGPGPGRLHGDLNQAKSELEHFPDSHLTLGRSHSHGDHHWMHGESKKQPVENVEVQETVKPATEGIEGIFEKARKFLNLEFPSSIRDSAVPHTEEEALEKAEQEQQKVEDASSSHNCDGVRCWKGTRHFGRDHRKAFRAGAVVSALNASELSAFQVTMTPIVTEVVSQYMNSEVVTEGDADDTCGDVLEEQVEVLVKSLKSALRDQLCNGDEEQQTFCNLFNGQPMMATLDILSRTGVNPIETSWVKTMNTPACQSLQLSDFVDSLKELDILADELSIVPKENHHDEHHKWGMIHGEKKMHRAHVRHLWQRLFRKLKLQKIRTGKAADGEVEQEKHETHDLEDKHENFHNKFQNFRMGQSVNVEVDHSNGQERHEKDDYKGKHDKFQKKFQMFRMGKHAQGEVKHAEEQKKHEKQGFEGKRDRFQKKFQMFRMGKLVEGKVNYSGEQEKTDNRQFEGKHEKYANKIQKFRLSKPVEGEMGPLKEHEKHEHYEKHWRRNTSAMCHEHQFKRLVKLKHAHEKFGRDCVSRTVRHAVKSFKRELYSSCESATSPSLIASCDFAKEHHFLTKVWLGLRHPVWTKAVESCAASAVETEVIDHQAGEGQKPISNLAKLFHYHAKASEWTHRNWRISANPRVVSDTDMPHEAVTQADSTEMPETELEPKSAVATAEIQQVV